MARDKGKAPRSVHVEDTKEPSMTVTGTGKDYGRAAVNAAVGADDPKIGGDKTAGVRTGPRGKNCGGTQDVGSPDKRIAECLKSGKTDY